MKFEILVSEIKRDVASVQALPPSSPCHAYEFRVEDNPAEDRFDVTRSPKNDPRVILRRVTVVKVDQDRIAVLDTEGTHRRDFDVIARWNAQTNTCTLEIAGTEVQPWEISRKALEPLFFDPPRR